MDVKNLFSKMDFNLKDYFDPTKNGKWTAIFIAFQAYNPSACTKLFGVHYGLYLKSLRFLGSEKH